MKWLIRTKYLGVGIGLAACVLGLVSTLLGGHVYRWELVVWILVNTTWIGNCALLRHMYDKQTEVSKTWEDLVKASITQDWLSATAMSDRMRKSRWS